VAEPPPETKKIRLVRVDAICLAPQYVAEELLRLERFTAVDYVDIPYTGGAALASGQADLTMDYVPALLSRLDAGAPVVALAGVHTGCYAIVGNRQVKNIRDLKGKRIAVSANGSGEQVFLSSMLAYVGIAPKTDIYWVLTGSVADNMQAFVDGKADAVLAFPPQPQELREKKLCNVIVDGTNDRPWSQYVCCVVEGTRDFVSAHPVATRRALRALRRATDLCAQDPERAARAIVAKRFEPRHDIALEVIRGIPYRVWRDINPEDAMRFHALRLYQAGLIKTAPQQLIAREADWRFLDQLRRELKA
jgi:NitT/TauT family transport system substrate-binding protein